MNNSTLEIIFICFLFGSVHVAIVIYLLASVFSKRKEKKMHLRYPEYYELVEEYEKQAHEQNETAHREMEIKKEIDFRVNDFQYRTKADQDICTQELDMYRHKLKDVRKVYQEKQNEVRSMGRKIDNYLLKHPELLKYVHYESWENPGRSLKERLHEHI